MTASGLGRAVKPFPTVTYGLIALNFLLFLYELTLSDEPQIVRGFVHFIPPRDAWIDNWGVVPRSVTGYISHPGQQSPEVLLRLITSQFIHAGWSHILGNMLFLWLFGEVVEAAMGHVRFLLFYLVCGVGAAIVQVYTAPHSFVPVVGASGAIAGLLGGCLALRPRGSISVKIPVLNIRLLSGISVAVVTVIWFLTQLVGLAPTANALGGSGGVAYAAHVGGFILGFALARPFATAGRSTS